MLNGFELRAKPMVCVSQWERETIGERTAAAVAHKRALRRVYNHEPYGYVRNGYELIAVDAEQAAIGIMAGTAGLRLDVPLNRQGT